MILVDQEMCIGCGICSDMCPDIFIMNSDGKAKAVKNECEECNLEEVASACPVDAIEI